MTREEEQVARAGDEDKPSAAPVVAGESACGDGGWQE